MDSLNAFVVVKYGRLCYDNCIRKIRIIRKEGNYGFLK